MVPKFIPKNLLDRFQITESMAFEVVSFQEFVPGAHHDRVAIAASLFSRDFLSIFQFGRECGLVAVGFVFVRFGWKSG